MNYRVNRQDGRYYGSFMTLAEAIAFAMAQAARLDHAFTVWSVAGSNVVFDTRS